MSELNDREMFEKDGGNDQCACGKMKSANVKAVGDVNTDRQDLEPGWGCVIRKTCKMKCRVCSHVAKKHYQFWITADEIHSGKSESELFWSKVDDRV